MDTRIQNHGYSVYGGGKQQQEDDDAEGMPPIDGYHLYSGEEEDVDGFDETSSIDFDDLRIANLPRIVLMGPRRAGKTSIQVHLFIYIYMHFDIQYLELLVVSCLNISRSQPEPVSSSLPQTSIISPRYSFYILCMLLLLSLLNTIS